MSKSKKERSRYWLCQRAAVRAAQIAGPNGALGVAVVFVFPGGATNASIATCNGMRDTRKKVKQAAEYALSRFDLEDGPDAMADFKRRAKAKETPASERDGCGSPSSGA